MNFSSKDIETNRRPNLILLYRIGAGVLAVLSLFSFLLLFSIVSDNMSEEELHLMQYSNKYRIGGSNFYKYQGKIYVEITGSGYVALPQADADSFEVFPKENKAPQIGWDKYRVFCANEIIPSLKLPITAIGNDLFTDGKTTYYCALRSERKKLTFSDVIKSILYQFHLKEKTIYDYHPIKLMGENGKKFFPMENSPFLTTDGTHFYYQGEKIEGAKDTIFPILTARERGSQKANEIFFSYSNYFSDGEHIFYKTQLLEDTFKEDLVANYFSQFASFDYLYHLEGGKIFVEDRPLNPDTPPYYSLIQNNTNSNHLFFTNAKGVYFYDDSHRKAKKALDENVFKGYKKVGDDYFSDGTHFLFLLPEHKWSSKSGLISFTTYICQLKPQAGTLSPTEIKNRIKNKTLSSADYEILGKAKSNPSNDFPPTLLWTVLIVGGIGLITYYILKKYNFNTDPFILEANTLRINNLFGKRYPYSEIKRVTFFIKRGRKFWGEMTITTQEGKVSNPYRFNSDLFILLEKEENLIKKIKDLRKILDTKGIKSEYDEM